MDKILVTGATGLIGRHLVDALVAENKSVRCLVEKDADVTGLKEKGVEIVHGDVADKKSLEGVMDSVGIVYHLAAVLSYTNPPDEKYDLVNHGGTKNLLELAVKDRVSKFVYFSSIGVVGTSKDPVVFNEDSMCSPRSPYEISKHRAECAVLECFEKHHLPTVIIRPSRVYGPGDFSELLTLYRMVHRGQFRFVGPMRQKKWSFCYVKNLVDASVMMEWNESCAGKIYFISDERPYGLGEFIEAIADTINVNVPKADVPLWAGRLGLGILERVVPSFSAKSLMRMITEHQMCDISKARDELGYIPKFCLKDGMRETVRWYKEKALLS